MRTSMKRGALLLLLALLVHATKMVVDAGAFRTIAPHFAGTLKTVAGIAGPEDVEYSPSSRTLFISADHRPEVPGQPTPDGALLAWSLAGAGAPTALTTDWKPGFTFHPHGLTTWDLPDRTRVWAINHRQDETGIEVFTYQAGRLTFEKSLRDRLLANANDLVAVDADRFYVTSDHGAGSNTMGHFEDYSRIGRGYVSFFDGTGFTVKAGGIAYANGVVFSAPPSQAGAKLLVASMLAKKVLIYDRDPATNALTFTGAIALDGAPDNLTRDEQGAIWVGAHPKLFALKAMSGQRGRRAPSQVLRITGATSGAPRVDEIMMDDGGKIAAASVALRLGDRLVIGSVFDDRLLDCKF